MVRAMAAPFEHIQQYGQLVDALKARRVARGLSCADVDDRVSFHKGFTDRLENWNGGTRYGRGLGPMSFGLWLEALGVVLVAFPVDESRVARPAAVQRQLSLDLIGGHMHTPTWAQWRRFPSPTPVDLAAGRARDVRP